MTIRELHNKALELADEAFLKRFKGELKESIALFASAFDYEKQAAILSVDNGAGEPTQSILLKSAAHLALNAELFRDAEKMISLALYNDPPIEIAEELRNLLEEVNFNRHLELQGTTLTDNELQLVIAGNAVSYGLARSNEVWNRLNNFEDITLRTIERMRGKPFRSKGKVRKEIKDVVQYFISVPRAASLAFTIRIGASSKQLSMPFGQNASEIIDEVIENLNLLNNSLDNELKEKIGDEAYFQNFVHLSKELAPDGNDVNLVGFTVVRNDSIVTSKLTRKKSDFLDSLITLHKDDTFEEAAIEELTGTLSYADSQVKEVKLLNGKSATPISVPEGLTDIVKNYWEENVIAKCIRVRGSKYKLIDLNKI